MNKAGPLLDRALKSIEENMKSADKKGLKKSDPGTAETIRKIFSRFLQIASDSDDSRVSNRTKLLIKNMLEDRANDWEKTKKQSQSGPKKVDDLRNEIIKK
jgi:hypothetical protein